DALQDTGFVLGNGAPAKLFSGFHQGVINTHFRWMKEYGIDGAFVQWFTLDGNAYRLSVAKKAKVAAELYGREFSIMIDFSATKNSNLSPACNTGPQVVECIKVTWMMAVDAGLTESPQYMKLGGLPLVTVWGFGYSHNDNMTAQDTINLLDWFHNSAPEKYRASVMGGVTSYWRTENSQQWQDAYSKFDVISPWAVAQSQDEASLNNFVNNFVIPDLKLVSQRNQKYVPVIFPGFSWYNLFNDQPKNQIPRQGGQFLWAQARAYNQLGMKSFYTAMFDEVNEGTSIMKTAATAQEAPKEFYSLTLDADGTAYPNDWYLQVSRAISQGLKTDNGFQSPSLPISP
ncbi:MAG: xylosidase, partial [Pseudobdellovibrionaceae bacterium]